MPSSDTSQHSNWYRFDTKHSLLVIKVHVQPGAKTTAVTGLYGDALKIRVAAPPVDGAANAELMRFIAQRLGVAPRQVSIKAGAASRSKLVQIQAQGLEPDLLMVNL